MKTSVKENTIKVKINYFFQTLSCTIASDVMGVDPGKFGNARIRQPCDTVGLYGDSGATFLHFQKHSFECLLVIHVGFINWAQLAPT